MHTPMIDAHFMPGTIWLARDHAWRRDFERSLLETDSIWGGAVGALAGGIWDDSMRRFACDAIARDTASHLHLRATAATGTGDRVQSSAALQTLIDSLGAPDEAASTQSDALLVWVVAESLGGELAQITVWVSLAVIAGDQRAILADVAAGPFMD